MALATLSRFIECAARIIRAVAIVVVITAACVAIAVDVGGIACAGAVEKIAVVVVAAAARWIVHASCAPFVGGFRICRGRGR